MPTPTLCLECNAPLAPSDTGGVCPKCLLKLGLASQLAEGTLPASAEGLRPDGVIEEPFDFGGYKILRLLGKGGMGAVYEAEQIETGRRVALKVLGQSLDTAEMRQRFTREGQLAASVRHGNVVAVLGAEEIEAIPVISMELLHDGTLKDRVKKSGPLAPADAVDAALQIIAGLESAHAAGVLHRDVKPANCFISADGLVKVGDFGLSISTLAQAEHSLTKSGTVLGTPAFAAPEQLRGEDIDVRADIYGIGATLYYLLTGKPAFEEESLVALIAAVLEKAPTDVAVRRPGISRGLAAVVMRCLAKNRSQRYKDYAALRAALQPYSSAAPTAATLGLRTAAGMIDGFASYVPSILSLAIASELLETYWVIERSVETVGLFIAHAIWIIGWYAIPEGLWGRSLGKAVCGLRVVRTNGQPITFGAALARAVIFSAANLLTPIITAMVYSAARYHEATESGEWLPTDWLWIVLFVPLFFTMRRRNGFAAIHDLCTGTRVVEQGAVSAGVVRAEPLVLPIGISDAERVGPYAIIERSDGLAEAFDPILRRRIWLQFVEEGTPAVAQRRRDLARATRLRWLQGRRAPGENWDAYDRPEGQCLVEKRGANEPWASALTWLAELADELHASTADGTIPDAVSQAHVWITTAGHAVLLDFPAPGFDAEPARAVVTSEHVQDFLQNAAETAITPRVPVHARTFLEGLQERRFEATAIVAGNLRAMANRVAVVKPQRRALSTLIPPFVIALFVAMLVSVYSSAREEFGMEWARLHPEVPSPLFALEVISDLPKAAERHREVLVRHLARQFGMRVVGDEFWENPKTSPLTILGIIDRFPTEYEVAQELGRLEREPERSSSEMGSAPELATLFERQAIAQSAWFLTVKYTVHGVAVACLLGAVAALLFRTSPMLRMCGFAVVRRDGKPAERWRGALRALIAAAPALLGAVLMLKLERWFWNPAAAFPMVLAAVVAAVAVASLVGVTRGRGFAERMAGTWLVPR